MELVLLKCLHDSVSAARLCDCTWLVFRAALAHSSFVLALAGFDVAQVNCDFSASAPQ
jgi:hypothetical protein